MNRVRTSGWILAAALCAALPAAQAADQGQPVTGDQGQCQRQGDQTLINTAKEMLAAGRSAGDITQELLEKGHGAAAVVTAVILAGGDVIEVVSRARYVLGPAAEDLIRGAALAACAPVEQVERALTIAYNEFMHPYRDPGGGGGGGGVASPH